MASFRLSLLDIVQGDLLKEDIIKYLYESPLSKKWKTLRSAIHKKQKSNNFDEAKSNKAIESFLNTLNESYNNVTYVNISESVSNKLNKHFTDVIIDLNEAADDFRITDSARGIFPRTMLSVEGFGDDSMLQIQINSKTDLRKYLPKVFRVIKDRDWTEITMDITLNLKGIGVVFHTIDADGRQRLEAETQVDGNFPSNSLANRLLATLKQEININKIKVKLEGK